MLRGQPLAALGVTGEAAERVRARPHGHAAPVWRTAKALGLPALLDPHRDLTLVVAGVVASGSKPATTTWGADTTLAADPGHRGELR